MLKQVVFGFFFLVLFCGCQSERKSPPGQETPTPIDPIEHVDSGPACCGIPPYGYEVTAPVVLPEKSTPPRVDLVEEVFARASLRVAVSSCAPEKNKIYVNSIAPTFDENYIAFSHLRVDHECASSNKLGTLAINLLDKNGKDLGPIDFDFQALNLEAIEVVRGIQNVYFAIGRRNLNETVLVSFFRPAGSMSLVLNTGFGNKGVLELAHDGYKKFTATDLVFGDDFMLITGGAIRTDVPNEPHMFVAQIDYMGQLRTINSIQRTSFLFYRHPSSNQESQAFGTRFEIVKDKIFVEGYVFENGKDTPVSWELRRIY